MREASAGRDPAPDRVLVPWQLIRVSGPSMVPTLRDGDTVLVRRGSRIRPGDVVLARFADLPGRLVVKRAHHLVGGGWWLVSDNVAAGGDSRTHGPGPALGRVVLVRSGRRVRWVPSTRRA